MKEKHFCRCCLSKECYKDMTNTYYIGNKTENYFDMLTDIFNINLINNDAERCLICEECVSKLRLAAAFKKNVLNVQETLRKKNCCENTEINMDTKVDEDHDDFDDFDDIVSDKDFKWDNFVGDGSQKGQVFFITLNLKGETENNNKTTSYNKEIEHNDTTNKKSTTLSGKKREKNTTTLSGIEKDIAERSRVLQRNNTIKNIDINSKNGDGCRTKGSNSDTDLKIAEKSTNLKKRCLPKNAGTAEHNKDKLNKPKSKSPETTPAEKALIYKCENTLQLVKNSNICLFRSLRHKFGCTYCPLTFPELIQLREHSLKHKNPTMSGIRRLRGLSCKSADISDLKCNICTQNLTDLQDLMDHLKKQHEIKFQGTGHYLVPYNLQNGHQCALCQEKFNTFLRLAAHMNCHYKNNVCDKCGISFINRLSLRTHVQAQHKEKKCSRCPAIFLTAAAKCKHLRQAHGIWKSTRYCNMCNKTFKHTYLLEAHKIQDHGAKKPEAPICVICGKKFTTYFNLKTHVRFVHKKERNYPCSKCERRFFTSCDMRRHERTHEEGMHFSCNSCDSRFKSKDSWRRHLKRQHGHVFGKAADT